MIEKNNQRRYRISSDLAEKLDLVPNSSGRYRLSKEQEDVYFNLINQKEQINTRTQTNQYKNDLSTFNAISPNGGIMDIETYCDFYSLDYDKIRSFKLVTHTAVPYYNIAFQLDKLDEEIKEIDFTSIFKDLKQVNYTPLYKVNQGLFDRFVYTDGHIGMKIEDDSLYGGVWDENILNERLLIVVDSIIHNRKSLTLVIDELGDFLDGYDGYTTRGGHKLPQNMDNQKAFDVGLSFKIRMVQMLIPYYEKIICNNVCEDNHAGSFGYIVNSAFKTAIEIMYGNVEVNNQRKFIDHYTIKNHTFILTHGKDSKSLKFGFKPILDKKQENKIDNYIKEHYLLQKGVKIEFSKGDSHQYIFDNATSQSFNYYNYPAFSISSAWVQANFQKGLSGAIFFNYYSDRKTLHEIIF
jgi:hypothetical protein